MLEEALSRGVLSLRRAARWMIDAKGWDATEEAVVSALRRYEPDLNGPNVVDAHAHLANARVNIRSGLALATFPRVRELQSRLPSFWWKVDGEDVIGLMSKPTTVHFLLDEDTVDVLRETLGPGGLEEINHPVSEVRISLPEASHLAPLSTAVILDVFGHREVEVLDIIGCQPDISVMVPGAQGVRAHETVESFIDAIGGA